MEENRQFSTAMQHIGGLFAVYQTRLKPPQKTVEKAAAAVITALSGIKVEDTDVKFTTSSRVLALRVPSVVKNEILLQQKAILEKLRLDLGPERAPTTLL